MTDPVVPRTTFRGFLFADLRDYSDYIEINGDHAGVVLLTEYRALVRSIVVRYEGAEIRTEGDSFYVVFPSASLAVSCGMEIITRAAAAQPPIRAGVGIHAGEAADTAEGPVGSAVNIAARVCAQARAGELIVTDMVRALTRTLVPYRFEPRGTPALKGISESIVLYRVVEGTAASSSAASVAHQRRARSRRAGIAGSLTVLALGLLGAALLWPRSGVGPAPPASTGAASTPASSATAVATPPPTPSSALSVPEHDLVSRLAGLTPDERAGCRSGTPEERASGAVVDVTCPLGAGGGADAAHFDLFDEVAVMLTAFDAYAQAHGDPGAECATAPLGGGDWQVPQIAQGHVLCYADGGGAHILWTYEGGVGAGMMGSASRVDGDWRGLYAWWLEMHPLIAH